MTATLPAASAPASEILAIVDTHTEEVPSVVSTIPSVETDTSAEKPCWTGSQVFWSTFVTIFLAELGDKTQITTLLMTAQSHSPWIVFAGAATALITTSLLGVLVGQWLAHRLSPKILNRAAGVMLMLVSALLIVDLYFDRWQ